MAISKFSPAFSIVLSLSTLAIGAGQKTDDSSHQCINPVSQTPHKAVTQMPHDSATGVHKKSAGDAASANQSKKGPDKELLFFMNPNGHPCQMQLAILDGMKDKLASLAIIKYVKTTDQADQYAFSQYGIRGLPSLIILDKNGKELKRFTPGIQDEKTILSALNGSEK